MVVNYMYMYMYICVEQLLVYVIGWSAVVFGINSTSNAGRKE